MNRFKQVISIALVLVLSTNGLIANAQTTTTEEKPVIETNFVDTHLISFGINHDGTEIRVSALFDPMEQTTSITGSFILEKKYNGSWYTVKTWSISEKGTSSVAKTYQGTAGSTYRFTIDISCGRDDVYDTSRSITLD